MKCNFFRIPGLSGPICASEQQGAGLSYGVVDLRTRVQPDASAGIPRAHLPSRRIKCGEGFRNALLREEARTYRQQGARLRQGDRHRDVRGLLLRPEDRRRPPRRPLLRRRRSRRARVPLPLRPLTPCRVSLRTAILRRSRATPPRGTAQSKLHHRSPFSYYLQLNFAANPPPGASLTLSSSPALSVNSRRM